MHVRKLCHAPRALTLQECSVGDPGFCSREDVLCAKKILYFGKCGEGGGKDPRKIRIER